MYCSSYCFYRYNLTLTLSLSVPEGTQGLNIFPPCCSVCRNLAHLVPSLPACGSSLHLNHSPPCCFLSASFLPSLWCPFKGHYTVIIFLTSHYMANPVPSSSPYFITYRRCICQFEHSFIGDMLLPSYLKYPSETLTLECVELSFFSPCQLPSFTPIEED